MEIKEIPFVIGTAGHIDHGKTSLVKMLTGVDLDSREEEKRRGITIELGFTPLQLNDGRVISIVDVPGHEKLIRQMVAGASGLDAVMLVVAADEGVMPQTQEHLDILGYLGVQKGIVVLTKIDRIESDMEELVREDVAQCLAGTFLEHAPVVAVSSVTGQGIDQLRQHLSDLTSQGQSRNLSGAYFLPVDRVFPVSGFGTVVTGTSLRGQIRKGDDVEILPQGIRSKVRSLQVHGASVEKALAGNRTALCLTDVEVNDLQRGDVVTAVGVFHPTDCLDVRLTLSNSEKKTLSHWTRVRLHIGTSDVLAHVALLAEKEIRPGQTVSAQLVLEEPIAVAWGQRFVIRLYSPLRTLGGGEVINPYGRKPGSRANRILQSEKTQLWAELLSPKERLLSLILDFGCQPMAELVRRLQLQQSDVKVLINEFQQKKQMQFVPLGEGLVLSSQYMQDQLEQVTAALKEYHQKFPERKGQNGEDVVAACFDEKNRKIGRWLLKFWADQGQLNLVENNLVALIDFEPVDRGGFEKMTQAFCRQVESQGFVLPTLEEMKQFMAQQGLSSQGFVDFFETLKTAKKVVLLDGIFVMTSAQLQKLIELLAHRQGGFSLADVKELTQASRKYTMPMMEHLDRLGVTRRVGDKRVVLHREL